MIIIGDVLSGSSSSGVLHAGLLESWFGQHWWNGRFFVLAMTSLGVFTPLACFKRIDSLRDTSVLAVVLAFVFRVITASIAVVKWLVAKNHYDAKVLPDVTDSNSIWALLTVVPVLVTAYVCHFNGANFIPSIWDAFQFTGATTTVYIGFIFSCCNHSEEFSWHNF